jgi:hypothetical protein
MYSQEHQGNSRTDQVLGTLGEAYAARHYAQETNLAMRGC